MVIRPSSPAPRERERERQTLKESVERYGYDTTGYGLNSPPPHVFISGTESNSDYGIRYE
jgi:hypothetical protein